MKARLFAASCLLLAAAFTALGIWQIERRAWKLDLIARVEARIHAAPVPLPPPAQWNEDQVYRRVRVTGTFLQPAETLVQAVTDYGAGWWVLTPLRTGSGTILVNRGFVSTKHREPSTRHASQPTGPVTITGLLRATEPGGGFLRSNDPAAGRWYSRDVGAIARARRLTGVMPFFLDADATPNAGGWPIGGLTVLAFRNDHLIYAITWFALAMLCAAGAVLLLRSGKPR